MVNVGDKREFSINNMSHPYHLTKRGIQNNEGSNKFCYGWQNWLLPAKNTLYVFSCFETRIRLLNFVFNIS